MSANSGDLSHGPSNGNVTNGLKINISGAAALKPTEIALEQIAGKKRSKFWVYAVEPIPGPAPPPPDPAEEWLRHSSTPVETNGRADYSNGNGDRHSTPPRPKHANGKKMDYDRSLEGSLSPLDSA